MRNQGQALIEVAVFFMALSVLMGGFCGFTKWMAVRQKLLLTAKQGAFLYSSGHLKRSEVEGRMRQYLISGSPRLNPDGIRVSVHPLRGLSGRVLQLDESVAEYTPPGGWQYLLGAPATIKETCVIKHAPHYWDPILRLEGPAVPYGH